MAAISFPSFPEMARQETQGKYLTAKETIGDTECQILLKRDASGQYREVRLTPVGTFPEQKPE
ncbi:MAG: hypothetical protein QUV05_20785 [Phycisphaerae bacterium]|jgi:hypothetical protein|nr:hypothetical protein [Phycisphaerae bacterium]